MVMGFELLCNMQVMCDGEAVCEFSQLDPTATVSAADADETDLPSVSGRPVTISFTMQRKYVRRMRADLKRSEAILWRAIARMFGWTSKRMRRMKKLSLLPARQFLVLAEFERLAAGGKA